MCLGGNVSFSLIRKFVNVRKGCGTRMVKRGVGLRFRIFVGRRAGWGVGSFGGRRGGGGLGGDNEGI